MTAKEYLQQARGMLTRIRALEERRQRYEDMATSATAHYRSGPGGSIRRVSSVEEYAIKLADLSEEMRLRVEIYAEALLQIEAAIDAISDIVERDILRYRYLNGWRWEKIAAELHYSQSFLYVLHGRALRCLRVPRDAEPVEETVRRALKDRSKK